MIVQQFLPAALYNFQFQHFIFAFITHLRGRTVLSNNHLHMCLNKILKKSPRTTSRSWLLDLVYGRPYGASYRKISTCYTVVSNSRVKQKDLTTPTSSDERYRKKSPTVECFAHRANNENGRAIHSGLRGDKVVPV